MKRFALKPLERSAAAFRRAASVIPGGLSRFLPMQNPDPVFLDRGEGPVVFDLDGNQYIDFNNNFTSIIHGHAHPAIVEAVCEQARKGNSYGSPTPHEAQLAEALVSRIPGVEQVRFQNTGTEAVLVAIKVARAYTGRPMLAKLEGAYHGFYDYAEVSQEFSQPGGGPPDAPASTLASYGTPADVAENVLVLPMNDEKASRRLISEHAHKLSAVLIDAMPGRTGMIRMTKSYAEMLRDICNRFGILLVDDEVMSLRVGHGGALATLGVEPDLVVLGKIIGGGMPIGAVGGKREYMSAFQQARGAGRVTSSGTYSANPVSLSAGYAALDLLTKDETDRLERMTCRIREEGGAILGRAGLWPQVLGAGSLFRFVLKEQGIVTPRDSIMSAREQFLQGAFSRAMLERGVWLTATGTSCLSTAMTDAHLDQFLDAARESVHDAMAG